MVMQSHRTESSSAGGVRHTHGAVSDRPTGALPMATAGGDGNVTATNDGGGRVLSAAQITLIYWGKAWTNSATSPSQADFTKAFSTVITGPWKSKLQQYRGASVGTLEAVDINDSSDPLSSFTDPQIWAMIDGRIRDGKVPSPSNSTDRIYCVIMPTGHSSGDTSFVGQHQVTNRNGVNVYWAWVTNDGTLTGGNSAPKIFCHEIAEACTDPDLGSGITLTSTEGDEIGDVCNNTFSVINGIAEEAYWSEIDNSCVLPVAAPGWLWHTIRNPNGTWQPTFGLIEGEEHNNPGAFSAISCAGVGSQLQVVGIVGGQLWHTIRNPDGSWQPTFGLIEGQERNNPGAFSAISCTGVDNRLQVVGMVGGQLWHTIRNPDGSWQPTFGLIEGQEHNNPGAFSAISCAGVGNQLQVVGIVAGQLWHTIRNPDGTWQPTFGLIEGQERNNPGAFSAISCAGVSNQLQVSGIVAGQLWHTIRNLDGTWQPTFGLIEGQEKNDPGAFSAISCSGVGNQLQVTGVV
jgi:hypothetical protein